MEPARDDSGLPLPPPFLPYVPEPRPKFRDRVWLHALLFILTIVTTTYIGAFHYLSFLADFNPRIPQVPLVPLLVRGAWYSGTILFILGCHELGHYVACRYYDVDASLPFFLPAPYVLTGTLGAFIRIRDPIPSKRMLFDIGIAGPIAGFLVIVPALIFGLSMSHMAKLPPNLVGYYELGEPLLFKIVSTLLWGAAPAGYSLNLHPVAFAAWFGLLATALNLFPFLQLDGGHIAYAVLGRKSSHVTLGVLVCALGLAWFYTSWRVWTALMILMISAFGRHHPPVQDEHIPLDRSRVILAVVALLMFALCFTPAPIEPMDLIRR